MRQGNRLRYRNSCRETPIRSSLNQSRQISSAASSILLCASSPMCSTGSRANSLCVRQCLAINFSARCPGQFIEPYKDCRYQLRRESRRQMRTDRPAIRPGHSRARKQVSNKTFLAALLLACGHHGLADRSMRSKTLLDFSGLDAHSFYLHLLIRAAAISELSVGKPADEIACFVNSATAKWVRGKSFFGQFRASDIASGYAGTADPKFANGSVRHRLPALIHHVMVRIPRLESPIGGGRRSLGIDQRPRRI